MCYLDFFLLIIVSPDRTSWMNLSRCACFPWLNTVETEQLILSPPLNTYICNTYLRDVYWFENTINKIINICITIGQSRHTFDLHSRVCAHAANSPMHYVNLFLIMAHCMDLFNSSIPQELLQIRQILWQKHCARLKLTAKVTWLAE